MEGNAMQAEDHVDDGFAGRPMKYIFVTGGVVSGLGKGITAASLGRLLSVAGFGSQCRNSIRI